MMRFYYSVWIAIVGYFYLKEYYKGSLIDAYVLTFFPFLIITLVFATFGAMYVCSREILGEKYARKNLIAGCSLTIVGGMGFVLWPLLVRSEIRKFRKAQPISRGGA